MKRTILRLSDFEKQAAAILAASKAKRGDGLRMEKIDGDDTAPDDDSSDDDDEGGDDEDDSSDDDADKGDDDKDDQKDDDKSSSDDKVDRAEYERVKRHRAAADRRNAELTAENTRLKSENESLKADGKKSDGPSERETQLERDVQNRDQQIQELRIHNAFLAANTFQWHDPADALRLADLRDVEIEEDGTVVGLKEALQKLAREKPHLIKSDKKDEPKGKSGSPTNGRRKGETKKPDRATLSKTYPVLAARR
jgi:hypothetical protein